MKKNYFLAKAFAVAAIIGLTSTANAQYFQENFSNGFAGNWAFLNADGLTPDPGSSFATAMGTDAWIIFDENGLVNAYNDTAAIANSWYNPSGQSDDWMWTVNAIDLTGATAPRLNWTAYSNSTGFLEDYEVYVDTLNTNFGPATTLTPIFSIIDGEATTETARHADLPSYFAGRNDVYIAFRQISTDDDILVIDDIVLAEAPINPDLVTAATPVEYTIYPLSQAANIIGSATVGNIGGDATGVAATVNVYELSGPTNVYTETTATQDIVGGATGNFAFSSYIPTSVGTYAVEIYAAGNESDVNTVNDTTFYFVQVDSSYARDDANINGVGSNVGIGGGVAGELGMTFDMIDDDTLTSVSGFIGNPGGELYGQPLMFKIYDTNAGLPNNLLGTTETITMDSTENVLYNLQVSGGLILGPGKYVVSVVEPDSNITVGRTANTFNLGTQLVFWNAQPWADISGFPVSFHQNIVVRPNFGIVPPTPVGISENTTSGFEVYPNPAVENIIVKNAFGSTIEIYNNLGQVVFSGVTTNNNFNVNVSSFDNGIYTIKSISGENTTTESFVKQ